MNLDAVSIALAQISFTIKTLSKKNFKNSLAEIANLVSEHGFEAERHLYRTLVTYLDLQSIEQNGSSTKRSENIHLNYWLQEIPSLISKPNFVTLICYAFDTAIIQKSLKLPSPSNGFFISLCKLLKLNRAQELVFVLALQNSTHFELRTLASEHIQQRLPEFIRIASGDNGISETGLSDLSIEVLHSLLLFIQQYLSNESTASFIKTEEFEKCLNLLRKEYPKERVGNNGSLILLPLLYPSNTSSIDFTSSQLLSDSSNLSTSVWQMDGSLADVIIEMGYNFTASVEDCRNALVHFGLQELKPSTIARMLSAMIKTHSGLNENTHIYDSNGNDITTNNEKNSLQTWNIDTFVLAINDLVPTVNWKDVVKELDHSGFFVRDRQALVLLVTALRRALPTELYIDLLYGRWHNVEGQLSWLTQAIRYPDVFCFGDHPAHPVLIDCLKHPLDDTKETWTWRSLNLIECLLRIADTGLYPNVLEIFKHGIQRSGELIFLGLLQLHTVWTTLKQELLQLIIPTFLANSPNANPLLNYMWNLQHNTTALRTTLLTSLADWYNRANDNEQQQRLSRVLEVVQDLKTLPILLGAQPMTFILDLACLASRRGYLKLDKWLSDKLREHQELFVQTTVQYIRKKAPQLLLPPPLSKDDINFKSIPNAETINVLLTVLQLALPSITNVDLIQEIQTMLSTAKILNTLTSTINSTSTGNIFSNTNLNEQTLQRPGSMSLPLNSQQLYHHSTSFTPSPTNPTGGLSQLRSLQNSSGNDSLAIGSSSSSTTTTTGTTTSMGEIADVDVYFKRLYSNSKTSNPPPISVDEFLDIMTRCKDSQIQREKDVFHHGIRNLFEEYKFYTQYPERELHLTAQLFGGLFERGLFQHQALVAAFRAILEGLKKPTGTNLWNFAVTALDRCKARIREQPTFVQSLRSLQTYSEIPLSIREYLEYGSKTNIQQQFDPLRTLTPTSNLPPPPPPTASPQPQISHSPMTTTNMFPRMNSGPSITNQQQYAPGNGGGGVGRENPGQKGPSLTQNANIRTLMSDPSYLLVRVKPPPEQINDKVAFTFNNLSFANLSQKAEELKEVLGNDDQLWKWVAQYLVMKRASIEPNFHSLYAGFINTVNVNILYDTVLTETHRNIKILLLSDKQMNNIPDRALLKNLGHWLGIITIAKNKPILATDLEIKSLVIEAYHMGSQELLYVIPFVAKILESCTRSKIFQQPNPWLMGIMSVLAEMHSSPDFKLNLKFEIEVLCRQLQIQLTDLPIHHILGNKEYFDKIEKQLSNNNRQSSGLTSLVYQSQQSTSSLYNDPAILNYHQLPSTQQTSTTTTTTTSSALPISTQQQQQTLSVTSSSSSSSTTVSSLPPVPKYKLSDFKPSIFQSLSSMLEINPNILLFQHHPRLKTYIHSPIEQAINESLQTVQRSLKVATSAAETIVRKDFLLNPDEQQLRTSARNMVAYLSSGLVLITARPALQDQIQSYIKTHLQTVLGVPQAPTSNSSSTTTNNNNNNDPSSSSSSSSTTTTTNGTTTDQLSSQTRDMIQQAATEIAASNIELCCCLLQRITIHRAIQLIDQRLAGDIEIRQRCRLEGRQLPTTTSVTEFQSDRLLEPIRLRYGPLSSHQLAIYEDFVHFIPGFKPSDNEKRDLVAMDETGPSVWDRLIAEIDQTIQTQHNQTFVNALQRLLESVNVLRTNLHNQTSTNAPQAALSNVLNIIIYNLLEHYTLQSQTQDGENLERFKNVHMSVLKLLVEIRLHMSLINKQLTKAWLECPNELKFNVYAVNQLIRNRLLDIRQMDAHVAQLIDSGNNPALHFAVNFLRNCVIEQPCCVDSDIASILDSLHRISLIGKQPAEAVRDLLEIIRLNYTSLTTSSTTTTNNNNNNNNSNESNSNNDNNTNIQSTVKIDKLAIISLSVISNGHKYLSSTDEIETATIANKAKHILSDWVTLTMTQTNRISQQQSFQGVFNQMNMQGLFRSDDTIAKFLRMTIQLCVNSVYDIIRQAPPITSSSTTQQAHYTRCHQGIDSLCRFLSLLTTHTSDINNYGARIHLINRILGILAAHCFADHEEQGDQFHPLAYQRIILNLFQESTAAVTSTISNTTPGVDVSSANEHVMYYIYLAFTNCLHLLRPQRVPGFAFAWLEIVAHRTFMSRLLLSGGRFQRQTHNMYALLLVDALRLVTPFIRSGEHAQSFQVYFKGILKTFMLLLHDFPEFLCEHYYQFCDALPLIAHQLRNIVLSAFPKHMRCPDPFLVNFKVDMLNDISIVPVIAYNFSQNIQPPKFKQNLDSYLRTRAPVTFLSELRSYLQQGADPGSHYNIRMLNALVLYVATQALSTLNNKTTGQPLMSSITHSAHMDIFQNLAVDLDTEGRYIFLNAMANHLRYPNTHTHYFSYTLLYLFAEANSEALQEQIVRVLLERLVANRPHPWGLLITFLELVRNPNLKLWSREFMSISPDVKRLFIRCYSTNHQLKWPSSRVRQTFIDYFTKHSQISHMIIPSSSVIPPKDSGTYFINSGMNQFKNIFLSQQDKIFPQCVVNYQKCIRVGGKHNDLSDVGHDTYHHTFFEMLGNWSFNNAYFKREACTMAYDLLTRIYQIEKNRLFFTYFKGENNLIEPDYETKQIWIDLGIDPKRILPFGMKENFWEMGEIGPCGPCTEIHYDHTGQGDPLQVNKDNPQVVELWNLVFMQYERRQDKSLIPLTHFHVDTGMGLERLVAVLNSFQSNYDTDLFTPLFHTIHSYCPKLSFYSQANKNEQYAYRLLADHARMFTIAIGDGLIPEKKGIGGLLKKMIERATRIAYEYLHINEENVSILSKLIPITTNILSQAYPDLNEKLNHTIEIVKYCELNYINKYKLAKPLLEKFIQEKMQKSDYSISGNDIYRLYAGKINNINVPLEMIEDYTRLYPLLKIDWLNFDELMREETRKSKIFSIYNKTIKTNQYIFDHPIEKIFDLIKQSSLLKATIDDPYKYQADKLINAELQLIIQINNNNQLNIVQSIDKNFKYYILLDRTNFYSTGGGQSSDHGIIQFSNNLIFHVENVFRLHEYILHYGYFLQNENINNKNVICNVDIKRRLNLSRNHTTTHLVNKILREILNDENLIQKASLIHEDYFIFEYSSININQTNTIFEELEKRVNEIINLNLPITISSHNYNSIRSDSNIYRLSNELYPSEVRCVNIGSSYSRELCCGTHISSTNQIEDFLIVRVDSKGHSTKRIYCLTSSFAKNVRYLFENDFKKKFHYLKENQKNISLDKLYNECRILYEIYLNDKSLLFPYNQRFYYINHWKKLIPEKKFLRKYLLNQLNNNLNKNYIQSNVDLPIYDIGYMLLRYNDENNTRKHQSYVIYINYYQKILIIYLKNPRQRNHLIEQMKNHYKMNIITNFDNYDQQTRDLFTITKKLIIFQPIDKDSFDKINFQHISNELFSNVF